MPVGWASPLSLVLKGGWGVGGCRWVTLPWPWTGLPSKGPQPVDLGGGQWQDLQRQIKGWHVCLDEHIHRVEFTVGNGGNHADAPVPSGRDLCVQVGQTSRNAQVNAAKLVQDERVEFRRSQNELRLWKAQHHLKILAPSVHACPPNNRNIL